MKIKLSIDIGAERERVWSAFDDTGNLHRWQPALQSFHCESGTPNHPGAVSTYRYTEKGKTVDVTETITERREQHFIAACYDARHGTTTTVNHFEARDGGGTRWTMHARFRFRGLARFISPFFKSPICRRLEDDMQRFKLMVESDRAGEPE